MHEKLRIKLWDHMKNVSQKALTFLIPHRCLLCREEVLTAKTVCAKCWPTLSFISRPFCDCCGFPFEYGSDRGILCGACLRRTPSFYQARAALLYSETSRALLLRFKHGDGTDLAPALANWLHLIGGTFLKEADFLVPIPLHWTRLLKRRYNQAALLAKHLSESSGVPCRLLGLTRCRKTPSQGTLTSQQRHQNVAGAFQVTPSEQKILKGKKVILIDDVYTSGATIEHAARTLKKAGVAAVYVLTVARVKR